MKKGWCVKILNILFAKTIKKFEIWVDLGDGKFLFYDLY